MAYGWKILRVKYGVLQRAAFEKPGGGELKKWIDTCPNQFYAALTYKGGAAWRAQLTEDLAGKPGVLGLINSYDDDALSDLMTNLGGNCVVSMAQAFDSITDDQPTCFVAYTVKGWGTPIAGHKDNHGNLMTPKEMADWRMAMGVEQGAEWERFAGVEDPRDLKRFLSKVPFFSRGQRRFRDDQIEVPALTASEDKETSTQKEFGRLLHRLSTGKTALADRS